MLDNNFLDMNHTKVRFADTDVNMSSTSHNTLNTHDIENEKQYVKRLKTQREKVFIILFR